MNLAMASIHALELSGFPGWLAWKFECLPHHPQEATMVKIEGAVCPLKTKGPKKGKPNYSKHDKSTFREFYITFSAHELWLGKWERRTGNCADCQGRGEVMQSWSAKDGTKMKPCLKCQGTGKAKEAAQ